MDKNKKNNEKSVPEKKEEKIYSAEELLKLGKEKNNMDFAQIEKKE